MKLHFLLISLLLLAISSNTSAGRFVLLDEQKIQAVKASIADGSASKATKDAYKRLLKDADKLLSVPNYSVVNKTFIPPGITAHDFVSLSSKWWPNAVSYTHLTLPTKA